MTKKNIAFFCIALLLTCTAVCTSAETFFFYVSANGEFSSDAITLTRSSGNYYLFLPGQLRPDLLKVAYIGTQDEVLLNGTVLQQDTSAAVLQHENLLEYGNRRIRFTVMQGSPELPVLYITTETGNLDKINASKKYKEPGHMLMTDSDGNTVYDGVLNYIKIRGNASIKFAKKNYQIKLEKGKNLLGMGKARKWILSANWLDKSFIRNELSYDLAEYMGLSFTPQHSQAELYVNHEYIGLYLFSEKVEINNNRLEIRDLEEETEKLNSRSLSDFKRIVRKLKNGE